MLQGKGLGTEGRHRWDEEDMGKWRQQVWGESKDTIEEDVGLREGSEGLGFGLCGYVYCCCTMLLLPLFWSLTI